MPVTLDTRAREKTARSTKGALAPREQAIHDATDAKEKSGGRLALGLWLGILLVLCAPWWFIPSLQTLGILMPAWCALAIIGFVLLAPTRVLGALRKEPKARVSSKNRDSLYTVLGKVAPLLNAEQPEAFVDAQSAAPRLRTFPGALIVNAPLYGKMSESEVNALAVRGLAHQRLGHARRLAIINAFERLSSPLFKVLAWPVWIYVGLLESLWLQHALQSADRVALLVIRNFGLLLGAIVKEKAANDAAMQELGVASSDVSNWVSQRGHIGMEGAEISTQYKLGRAIHENPPFEQRILNLQSWSTSPEFDKTVEQLARRR